MNIETVIENVKAQVELELKKHDSVGLIEPYDSINKIIIDKTEVPSHIEHSLLNPDISKTKITEECFNAKKYGMANVCVSPYYISIAAEILRGSSVAVCAPIGFPHGAASTAAKVCEIREATRNGAKELDVALNILAIKSGEIADARSDLEQMVATAVGKAKVKAIYEQSLFNEEEKTTVLQMIKTTGCDFVKISNALTGKAALEEDIVFVRNIVGRNIGIKIDGKIRTLQRALEILNAGADRIGLSASVAISKEAYEK